MRLRLLKIAGRITETATRVRIAFAAPAPKPNCSATLRAVFNSPGPDGRFERELILARTSEGRARAKPRGQSLGRPHKLTLHQWREALQRKEAGEPVREIARIYAVSARTISRLC